MIQHWLKPLSKNLIEHISQYNMSQRVDFHHTTFPKLEKNSIVIFGVDENYDAVRKVLYSNLQWHFGNTVIADLGNLKKGEEMHLQPIVQELIEGNIFPIILGLEGNLQNVVERILVSKYHKINIASIDSKINFSNKTSINYIPIGYQQHFIDPEIFDKLDLNLRNHLRLGQFKANNEDAEVLLRSSTFAKFDVSCIRGSDAPGQLDASPNGLYSEEWCLLNRFSGISDATKIVGISGYAPDFDIQNITAKLLAQGIWYMIEGFSDRMGDYPYSLNNLVEYVVDIQSLDQYMIIFWKSTKSGRWWLEIDKTNLKTKNQKMLIPCTYNDYLKASNNEIPDRLIKAISFLDED